MAYPAPLERLIDAFEALPGIGRRSAERLAFHLLRNPRARELAPAIQNALSHTRVCRSCFNVAEHDPCKVCSDDERDGQTLCVVEEPRDVEAFERAGVFRGRYHVLMGAINPAEGVDPAHLSIDGLVERVTREGVREVILATDPDAEGEATALSVVEALDGVRVEGGLVVTRMARGLPAGSAIEYLHRGVLEDALEGRRALRKR